MQSCIKLMPGFKGLAMSSILLPLIGFVDRKQMQSLADQGF